MKYFIPYRKNSVALIGLAAIFQVAIAGIVILPSEDLTADDGVDGNIAWNITGDTLTLSVQQGQRGTDMRDYTIYYADRPLWEGVAAWNNVTIVVINDGVSTVGNYAFSECTSLTSVTIPDSVTTIGTYAFQYCTSLTSVTIPDSVYRIESYAFSDCTSLATLTLGNSIYTIGEGVFSDCTSLTSVTIPDSVTTLRSWAFQHCTSLTSVTIGNNITSIGTGTFSDCTSLTSVTFGNRVSEIGVSAFSECTSLTSVAIPDSVTTINGSAFYNCSSLKFVAIGNGVTAISSNAFSLGAGRAFYDLDGNELTQDATNLAGKTFIGETQSALYQVTDGGAIGNISWYIVQNTLYINPIDPTTPTAMPDFTASDRPAWIQSGYWSSVTDVVIGSNITNIGNYAFYAHTAITSITIPNSVTAIGEGALQDTYSLTTITIPNSVTEIGASAFTRSELQSITFGTGLTTIGQDVFRSCGQLTSITIPDNVTSIGQACFYSCSSLQSITFGNGLTEIPFNTFGYCSALTNVVLSDSITTISLLAFQNCSALTSIDLKNVQTIGTEQFEKAGINNLTIPDSVTSIGDWAFREMPNLTDIVIGKGLTSIPAYMCTTCPLLASVIIPNTITSIGNQAFSQSGSSASMQVYVQSETPATIGFDQFTSYTGFVIWVSEQSLTDYKTNWATWEQNIQAVPHVTISVPASLDISVYGGQTITPIIAEDTKWYSDLTFESQDSTLVSVDSNGNLTAYSTVSSVQITVSVYEWFYEQNATEYTLVDVIYNAESNVDVISGQVYNYTLTPSVTPATIELYGTAANWVSVVDDYTIYGIVPTDISDLNDLVVVQKTIQPDQTYSWHITFTQRISIQIEIGANATAWVYPDGEVDILGSGQTYADVLIPYANLITAVDIRGLTTITDGTLPLCVNPITLVLGDSVKIFVDTSGNTIEGLVLGMGLLGIPSNLTLYDTENVKIFDVNNAVGHIFVRPNNNNASLYQVDSVSTRNYYNDSTCYAVAGKSLVNSPKDLLELRFTMLRTVPHFIKQFIEISTQNWEVTTPSGAGFTDVGVRDGILVGTAQTKTGTYNCSQIHNIRNDQFGSSDWLCTLSPLGLEFTIFVEKELIIG